MLSRDVDLIVFPELILQGHRFSTAPRKEIEGIIEHLGINKSLNYEID